MQVTLTVPEDLAEHFAEDATGLSRAALEALALEGVRSGKLTIGQARRLLGFRSRYELYGRVVVPDEVVAELRSPGCRRGSLTMGVLPKCAGHFDVKEQRRRTCRYCCSHSHQRVRPPARPHARHAGASACA